MSFTVRSSSIMRFPVSSGVSHRFFLSFILHGREHRGVAISPSVHGISSIQYSTVQPRWVPSYILWSWQHSVMNETWSRSLAYMPKVAIILWQYIFSLMITHRRLPSSRVEPRTVLYYIVILAKVRRGIRSNLDLTSLPSLLSEVKWRN
jgi:hypothetical protein